MVVEKSREKGFALVMVLLVTTLVVVLALEFNYEMRINANIVLNSMDDIKAYYIAKGGIAAGIYALRADYRNDRNNKKFVDYKGELWSVQNATIPVGEGTISGSITDEDGKVCLNDFLEGDEDDNKKKKKGESKYEQQQNVVRFILDNMPVNYNNTEEIIESMKDWIGETYEDDPAIMSYYENLAEPYESKVDFFDDPSELLLLKGIQKDFYFQTTDAGSLLQVSQPLDDNKAEGEKESKKKNPPKSLDKLFTVYSLDLDDRKARININTAPPEVLRALHEDMDDSAVSAISYRQANNDPFASLDDVKKESMLAGIFDDQKEGLRGIKHLIDVRSYFFRIKATGTVRNANKTIEAIVFRSPDNGSINIKSWAVY